MHLLIAILLAFVGMSSSRGSLLDVPFAQLTLGMLLGNLFAMACYLGAGYFAFRSFAEDRIWPWRWTIPLLGNFVIRLAVSALFAYGGYAFIEKKQPDGWLFILAVVVVGLLILFVFFSSEFEHFKEAKKTLPPSVSPSDGAAQQVVERLQ
jgi:hypothetical protein